MGSLSGVAAASFTSPLRNAHVKPPASTRSLQGRHAAGAGCAHQVKGRGSWARWGAERNAGRGKAGRQAGTGSYLASVAMVVPPMMSPVMGSISSSSAARATMAARPLPRLSGARRQAARAAAAPAGLLGAPFFRDALLPA